MGLAAKWKHYVANCFPECVLSQERAPPADGVVIDVMVLLHTFAVKDEDEDPAPAQRLADSIWYSACDARAVAFCFDVADTTPLAKHVEWDARPQPTASVTVEQLQFALMGNGLTDHYSSVVSLRELRAVLCSWLKDELLQRFAAHKKMELIYFFGVDEIPTYAYFQALPAEYGGRLIVREEERDDLYRSLHGEADISGTFAATVLRSDAKCGVVESRTSDSDWALLGAMHAFPGFRVRLHHFDRASKQPIFMTIDVSALAAVAPARYNLTLHEWAAITLSRGSDYVDASIKGLPDWENYFRTCATVLFNFKKSTRRDDVVTPNKVDTQALHYVFVHASDKHARAKIAYTYGDSHLPRLAWHLLYATHAVHRGGLPALDCMTFGWARDEATQKVVHAKKVKQVVFQI